MTRVGGPGVAMAGGRIRLPKGMARALEGVALACLGLLMLQAATSFLPYVVVLHYLTTTRIILAVGLLSLGLAQVGTRGQVVERQPIPRDLRRLYVLVAALLAWLGLSAVVRGTGASLPLFRLQLEEMLAFLFVVLLVRDERRLKAVTFVIFMAVSAVSIHALRQFVDDANTNYFIVPRAGWRGVEALAPPPGAISRVTGYFTNPNILATYLLLALPVAVYFVRRAGVSRWAPGLLAAIGGAALLLTFSRGAVIALLVPLGFLLARKRPLVVLPALLLLVTALANPLSIGRLATGMTRLTAWSIALRLIGEHPILGVGPGNFRAAARGIANIDLWHAHNLYLHTAAEAGILAGALLLAVLITAVLWSVRLARRKTSPAAPLGAALAVAFAAFGIISLADNAYNTSAISYTFWLLLGVLVAAQQVYAPRAEPPLMADEPPAREAEGA